MLRMKRVSIGVLSEDREYVQRLMTYIRQSEYKRMVSVVLFTDMEYCKERFSKADKPDLLLADSSCLQGDGPDWLREPGNCVILLQEETVRVSGGLFQVEKYQALNRLMDTIMEQLESHGALASRSDPERSFVLGVYSVTGGAGKTVFSYIASGLLARMGFRPLVITLESVPSLCWRAGGQEDAFGRALYEVTKAGNGTIPGIDKYCQEDGLRRVHLLPAACNEDDLEQMSLEDAGRLIASAAASLKTDTIILDLDSSLYPRIQGALEQCDKVVCLVPDNLIALDKTRQFLDRFKEQLPGKLEQISLIMNGCGLAPTDASALGYEVEDALPLQADWQHLSAVTKLDHAVFYHERLNKWLASVLSAAGHHSGEGGRV
jgi:cellulose biosynthesis protein BcsQ